MQADKKIRQYSSIIDLIPIEIWLIILVSFPIKALFKLRSVSKSFRSIIDDPIFVFSHLRQSPNNVLETRFLTLRKGTRVVFDVVEVDDVFAALLTRKDRVINKVEKPDVRIKPLAGRWNLVCSLDGLVILLTTRHNIKTTHTAAVLWNPSIWKHRHLTLPSLEIEEHLGFGYHSSCNDYKAVALHRSRDQAWLYSVKTNSWTDILDRRFTNNNEENDDAYFYSRSISLKNRVFWMETDQMARIRPRLVCFDFETETFSYADKMPYVVDLNITRQGLIHLDGGSTVGMWWANAKDQVDIWALEIETMSWTIRYKLAPHEKFKFAPQMLPLSNFIDRCVLVERDGELVWKYWEYNLAKLRFVKYDFDNVMQMYRTKCVGTVQHCLDAYFESLLMLAN